MKKESLPKESNKNNSRTGKCVTLPKKNSIQLTSSLGPFFYEACQLSIFFLEKSAAFLLLIFFGGSTGELVLRSSTSTPRLLRITSCRVTAAFPTKASGDRSIFHLCFPAVFSSYSKRLLLLLDCFGLSSFRTPFYQKDTQFLEKKF